MSLMYEVRNIQMLHGHSEYNSYLQYPAHLHNFIELVRMLDGEVDCFADSRRYRVRAGDLFIAFPNQIHYYESFGPEKYDIFLVSVNLLSPFSQLLETNTPKSARVPAEEVSPRMHFLLDCLIDACRDVEHGERYAEERREGYLTACFGEYLKSAEMSGPGSREASALKTIVDYCSRHYTEDLSLATLSEELHMSKYYISHIFGNKVNMRFNDYINSLRISKACVLLAGSEKSMTEICDQVGFSTIRTFNRAFLRQFGHSPSEYRRTVAPYRDFQEVKGKKPDEKAEAPDADAKRTPPADKQ